MPNIKKRSNNNIKKKKNNKKKKRSKLRVEAAKQRQEDKKKKLEKKYLDERMEKESMELLARKGMKEVKKLNQDIRTMKNDLQLEISIKQNCLIRKVRVEKENLLLKNELQSQKNKKINRVSTLQFA